MYALLNHSDIQKPTSDTRTPDGYLSIENPATQQAIAYVKTYDAQDLNKIIARQVPAQKAWASHTAHERADILMRWYQLMLEHQETLANILTQEQGKSLTESRGEIAYGASFVRWFAEQVRRMNGDVMQAKSTGQRMIMIKQAIGVTACITPWNFPCAMITRKVAPALAVGCSMIVKPDRRTPLSAYAMLALAHKAGVPEDVFTIVCGDSSVIGKVLCESSVVRKISFTGSTEVGRILMRQCAPTIKKLSLELGGNAPFIVFDDAHIERAVQGAMISKFRNSGQTCVCANRLYVQRGIYDSFAKALAMEVAQLKVGDGREVGVQQGPLIDMKAVEKVEEHIGDACKLGARVIAGGKRHELGYTFFEPTVLVGVTQKMRLAHEETFGPVAGLIAFDTEEEVIAYANDSEFGLASYFYTRDLSRAWRIAEAIEAGMVGVNTGLISNEIAPFGGVKESGLGREGSVYGMDEYCEMKYICFDVSAH